MNKVICILFLLIEVTLFSQNLKIQKGIKVNTSGVIKTSLNDLEFENNGTYNDQVGSLSIHSNTKNIGLSGNGFSSFNHLLIDSDKGVTLNSSIEVKKTLELLKGNVDLTVQNLILPFNESKIIGEDSQKRVTSSGTGEIIKTTTANNLLNEDIGNLGLIFQEFSNEGSLEIRRGHQEVSIPFGTSITRYYKVRTQKKAEEKIELDLKYYEDEILVNDPTYDETIWVHNGSKWNNLQTNSKYLFNEGQFVAEARLELYESIITVGLYKKLIDRKLIPTAFTPNGDSVNDQFIIPGIEKLPNSEVRIYSKTGEILYQTQEYDKYPWDGLLNGESLPFSTYYFKITDSKNPLEKIEGEVSIVK